MVIGVRAMQRSPVLQAVGARSISGKLSFHYGWVILAVSACFSVAAGFSLQSAGIAFTYLHHHMGWGPGQIALAGSLFFLTAALVGPAVGVITDRYGAAMAAAAGIALTFLGVLLAGAATEIWHFWVGYGLFLGLAFNVIRVATTVVVSEWFQHRFGVAIGILQASFAAGPAAIILVFSMLLETVGWRGAVWTLGLLGCAVLGALMLLYRGRPADMGMRAYGAERAGSASLLFTGPVRNMRGSAYWNSLKKSGTFWNLNTLQFLGSVSQALVVIYIVPVAEDFGIGHITAAGILSVLTAVSMVSRFCGPIMANRLGSKWILVGVLLLQGLPVLALFWGGALWQFYLIAALFGLGFGGMTPVAVVFIRKYFGPGPMGRPIGCYEISTGLAVSAGLWLSGMSYDFFGTYDYIIALASICSLAGAALAASLKAVDASKYHEWERHLPIEARSRDFFQSTSMGRRVQYTAG